MRIVKAGVRDLDRLVPLFIAYRAFYNRPSVAGKVRAYLRARLTKGEATVFLAVEGSGPRRTAVGFTLLYPTHSSLSMARAWVLNDLYVAPDARRGGVARGLMEAGRQLGLKTGAAYLRLETADDNLPAQALYESLGWRQEIGFRNYELSLP